MNAMGMELKRSAIAFLLLLFVRAAHSFYLPGVAPQDFEKGDELKVKVNKLTSIKTQLPYSYYSLPFCQPKKIVDSTENLGEVLRGDRIENAPYSFKMREAQMCNILCRVTLDAKTAKAFKEKIDDEYRVNMILDNLPLVVPIERVDQGSPAVVYQLGYHVGLKGQYEGSKEQKFFMHNHLAFTVRYHRDVETDAARIVGFEVKPYSVKHEYDGEWSEKTRLTTCDPHKKRLVVSSSTPQEVEQKKEIIFTYDESEVKWASRWDAYLLMNDNQIHWFSIVNSLMIVLFLSGMVAMIMLRTLYRDISRYNELETQEEAQEETGWKLVHGDVFRLPTNSDLLCVYVGTGVQCLGMVLVTMIFAMLGFLSPSNRGGLMTAMLLLWVFMGLFAGYASSRLYKMFKGTEWKRIAFRTAFLFPAVVSSIFFVLNALIWGQKSSGAVPFGTMFALIFLWFGISVPLVFVGAYLGFKKPAVDDPVKTNKIPRQIPEQAWYMNPVFSILIGGILPFGAVFIELFFILTSIWLNQFYYIFGFLFLVFVILIVTCAEITVVLCYFQLCSEDYLWWWRSYLTSGSSALYLFLYATFYFFTKLQITKLVSAMLYFGYMLIASYAFFVLTGTIGFYACLWFTRLIYSSSSSSSVELSEPNYQLRMANNQNGRHTIILLQNSPSRATRTFMDYDSIGQAIDGSGLSTRRFTISRNLPHKRAKMSFNTNLLNILIILYVCLNWGCSEGAREKQKRELDFHTIRLSSLFPSSSAPRVLSTRASNTKSSLHVTHRHGTCSRLTNGKATSPPDHAEILKLDQARVNTIHSKLSKKLPDLIRQSTSTDLPAEDGSAYGSANYVVTVGIGTPEHDQSLMFDTGSDLTWIQCEPCVVSCYYQEEPIFNPSSSSSYRNKLEIPPTVFSTPGALIDSGTVVSRLPPKAYAALRSAFKAEMSQYPTAAGFLILDTCFDFTGFETVTLPRVSFTFSGSVVVDLEPTGILYSPTTSYYCLAFAGNDDDGKAAIFGSAQQQTLEVVYDGVGGRVGFAPNGCN
ncbi:hypothetical protein HID58_089378 [Brassica napus]|uniref:Peptidase A1 domain-containing protein n=1 Tax=Brassica napus TaxID=3708 RepID=A0ABQ7Y0K1_BRANA|nr:hypothetical protein HID58_089378 [Brassica napus]